ncbi:calmodulin binding protein PICBP-like protein [Tanacetum coccineum]
MVNLRALSPQSHDLKKIMKKPRPVKMVDESRSLSPPFKKKKKTQPVHDDGARLPNYMKSTSSSFEARKEQTPKVAIRKLKMDDLASGNRGSRMSSLKTQHVRDDGARSTPNYMKSTISFEARKEQSPKTTTPKVARKLKMDDLASGNKGSRMSSLKTQLVHDDGARSTPNYMKSTSSFEAKKEQSPKTTTPKVKLKWMSSLKTQLVHDDGARSTPNYMKSTSSFEAKKEQSPKTTTPKVKLKTDDLASGNRGSRMSSLKTQHVHDDGARSTPNYMKSTISFEARMSNHHRIYNQRPLKKVILGEDLDAQRATCSSTLKESKFPAYLQLDHGGTESEGTSAMKVCQYTYCSLIGHHTPLPQKSFKVRCLSPSQRTPMLRMNDVNEPVHLVATEAPQKVDMEEENRDFFLEIYSKDRQEKGNQDLEGYCSALFSDDADDFCKEKNQKTGDDRLYSKLQQLYDGETLTSGAWPLKKVILGEDLDLLIEEKNIECGINYQHEKTSQESKTVPEFEKKIQKPEHSEADKGVAVHVHVTSVAANETDTEELNEAMEEKSLNNEDDDAENITSFDEASEVNQMVAGEEVPVNGQDIESMDFVDDAVTAIDEPESKSDEEQKHVTDIKTASSSKKDDLTELQDSSINLRGFTRGKKSNQEMDDDSKEFNPRGPNFLPGIPDPDAETVDLKHQTMDERKNAEEWMVDFALQQAVTTLAPARKKRVSLLVEAFEKVLPIPKYETQKRPTSKSFTNTRQCKLAAERVLNKEKNLHLQSSVQSLQSSAEN